MTRHRENREIWRWGIALAAGAVAVVLSWIYWIEPMVKAWGWM